MNKENKIPLAHHLLYFILSGVICYLYYKRVVEPANFDGENSINQALTFEAMKPYQFRLLVPFIFFLLKPVTFLPQKIIFILFDLAVLYLLLVVYHKILLEHFLDKKKVLWLTPVILYPVLWNYVILNQTFQYYDFMAILLFAAGLYYILKDDFKMLLPAFVIGLINKDTVVYLIFAYVLFNYKILFTKKIIFRAFVLSVIFIVYKLTLTYIFRNNPGDFFEYALDANIRIFKMLPQSRVFAKQLLFNFGGLYVFIILLFVTGKWKLFPDKRKITVNLIFIPYILLGFFIIYFTEVRVYSELVPSLTTLFIIYLSTFKKLNLAAKPLKFGKK